MSTRHRPGVASWRAMHDDVTTGDHYPTCPRCGDLCGVLAAICVNCGCRLRLSDVESRAMQPNAAEHREDLPPADGTERC